MIVITDPIDLCIALAASCVDDGPADLGVTNGADAGSVWTPARLAFERAIVRTDGPPRDLWLAAAELLKDPHWLEAAIAEAARPVPSRGRAAR